MLVEGILKNEKKELREFISLLKRMSENEKQQLKGVMVGIILSKRVVFEVKENNRDLIDI